MLRLCAKNSSAVPNLAKNILSPAQTNFHTTWEFSPPPVAPVILNLKTLQRPRRSVYSITRSDFWKLIQSEASYQPAAGAVWATTVSNHRKVVNTFIIINLYYCSNLTVASLFTLSFFREEWKILKIASTSLLHFDISRKSIFEKIFKINLKKYSNRKIALGRRGPAAPAEIFFFFFSK